MTAVPPGFASIDALMARARRVDTDCGDGIVMVWHVWGAGPPVALLHGGSGAWNHWLKNIDTLVGAGRTVWAADLPGCGDSGLPRGAIDADSIHAHVATGLAVAGAGAPVDLVGFSFGSLVAGLIAADFPAQVARLVLVAPPALGLPHPDLGLVPVHRLADPREREAALRHNLAHLMIRDPARIDATAIALHGANLDRDRLRLRRLARSEVMQALKLRWRCPVHAIWGRDDVLARVPPEHLRGLFDGMPLASFALIDDAGHWVQYEQPAAFDRALRDALDYNA